MIVVICQYWHFRQPFQPSAEDLVVNRIQLPSILSSAPLSPDLYDLALRNVVAWYISASPSPNPGPKPLSGRFTLVRYGCRWAGTTRLIAHGGSF
jgi:hypothetical protein